MAIVQTCDFQYIYKPKTIDLTFKSEEVINHEHIHSFLDLEAEKLAKRYFPYDDLCWQLAELELISERGIKNYTNREVFQREQEIFDDSPKYIDICWLIAELNTYLKHKGLYI